MSDDTPVMTIDRIIRLREKRSESLVFLKNDKDWIYAFNYYNYFNTPKLMMECRPCYHRVLLFIVKHYEQINAIPTP